MRRRAYLLAAATAATVVAGCGGQSGGSGPVVDETVTDNETFDLELSAGDEVSVGVTLDGGAFVIVEFIRRTGFETEDETVFTENVESELSRTVTAESGGTYSLIVATATEATASVLVEVA